jgi:hypothetical protein
MATGMTPRLRSAFVPVARRLVARLKKQDTHTIAAKNRWLGGKTMTTIFRVTSLWTFGSFARGALECGDLDILVSVELVGGVWCDDGRMIRAALGNVPGVDVLCDHDGRLLNQFPEAKLLWSPADPDLDRNLAAIRPDPEAKRFGRKTDRLPVSIRRLHCNLERAEELVDAIDAGVFTSEWIPLESIQIDRERWPADLVRMEGIWTQWLGKASRKLVPYYIQHSVDRCAGRTRPTKRHERDRACLQISGVFVHIGRPALCTHRLDRPDVNAVVLAPHITRNHPSGFWVLERGDNHPSVAAFSDLSAWVESEDGHSPAHISYGTHHFELDSLELFPTRASVEQSIRSQKEQLAEHEMLLEPLELSGRALLEAISHTEALIGVNAVHDTDDDDEAELLITGRMEVEELAARLRVWKSDALGGR